MVFLTVPYAEKDAAKALGARWNPTRRRWYVPDGVATEPFAKWLDGAPGPDAVSPKPGRVDSYQGKTVVGLNYLDLAHDCDPTQACPSCSQRLADTPWAQAQANLRTLVGAMPGISSK
jgi:hypothetical protein